MANEKILVVEDEKSLSGVLRYNLEKSGYRVIVCEDGPAGLRCARQERPDLLLLDVMLPGLDGFEVLRQLRRSHAMPVLMLTAKGTETDRVAGLKGGADDYMSKPFSVAELLARVEALLRRARPGPAPRRVRDIERIGDVEMDRDRREVRVSGRRVLLGASELEAFGLLVEADGKLVEDSALARVLGGACGKDLEEALDGIRRELGREGARITGAPGGYRLRLD